MTSFSAGVDARDPDASRRSTSRSSETPMPSSAAPSLRIEFRYICGYAGYFVAPVLAATTAGKAVLDCAWAVADESLGMLERFVNPLLADGEPEPFGLAEKYASAYGELASPRISRIAGQMQTQTDALGVCAAESGATIVGEPRTKGPDVDDVPPVRAGSDASVACRYAGVVAGGPLGASRQRPGGRTGSDGVLRAVRGGRSSQRWNSSASASGTPACRRPTPCVGPGGRWAAPP